MAVEANAGHGFEVGDMVWVKVKYSPWWPGHVYSEEFATPLVRQSKREGLLLVAFFGASSYGWFDSSELVPFDLNYKEKCGQNSSKAFLKAVEDAMVEVRRRCGLGLCCNKQSFREIGVEGFVSVDVAGYDPGAVYSVGAVGKAREGFRPRLTLDFLRELALEPTVSEDGDIDFVKNKATVLSYRKAVFDDFDQAFGCDPVRASIQEPAPRETSSKAPLGGKKVFADSLGKDKNTAKEKDHAKKDEYLFKRRDEYKEIEKEKEKATSSPLPFPFKDSTIAAGSLEDTPPTVFEFNDPCFEMGTSIVESPTSCSVAEVDQAKLMSADEEKRVVQEVKGRKLITQKLSRVLGDLLSLAVDPCSTVNRGSRIKTRNTFLRFRSLVFQNSQNFSLLLASGEPSASKSSVDSVEVPLVKPQGGLKRDPSDLLEEMAAVKRKKVGDVRNLTKEKKVIEKIEECPVEDDNQPIAMLKKPRPELIKKTEQRAPGPTMLMIKFPQGGFLPSFGELKARFAQYGPMDHSATQIFRNTFLCRVAFRHKAHAQAAYKFVVGSSSLFGNTDVKCRLKEVGNMGEAEPEPPIKIFKENCQPAMEDRSPSMGPASSGVQLSIPKISGGEVAAGNDSLGKVLNTAKPKDHAKKEETALSRILSDLHSLAIDPFYTVNRGPRIKGKKAILKFRSLVFKKSQHFSLPLAAGEVNASKSSEDTDSVEVPPVKPQGGLKRGPSDLHEEVAAAKKKKVGDVPNLSNEKMLTKKMDEPPARDVKQPVATTLKKPGPELIKKTEQPIGTTLKKPVPEVIKKTEQPIGTTLKKPVPELIKKTEQPIGTTLKKPVPELIKKTEQPIGKTLKKPVPELIKKTEQPIGTTLKKPVPELIKKTDQRALGPTMLTIKFAQRGPLPSYNDLKARFVRYGPMDHSATHIFWNTFSCQVLFRHKAHAQAAHRFVVGSKSLFGNTVVKCSLKDVEIVGSAVLEPPVKVPKEDQHLPEMENTPPSMVPATSGVQPKSILKKSDGEEAADSGGRGRVKFMLGGEDKSGATSLSSHLTMDSSSKNFQKAVHRSVVTSAPSPSPPASPPPSMHYGTTPLAPPSLPPATPCSIMQMTQLQVRNKPPVAPLMTPNVDITQQMLTLLTRCHDVVTNVSRIFGYTPYHSL